MLAIAVDFGVVSDLQDGWKRPCQSKNARRAPTHRAFFILRPKLTTSSRPLWLNLRRTQPSDSSVLRIMSSITDSEPAFIGEVFGAHGEVLDADREVLHALTRPATPLRPIKIPKKNQTALISDPDLLLGLSSWFREVLRAHGEVLDAHALNLAFPSWKSGIWRPGIGRFWTHMGRFCAHMTLKGDDDAFQ